MAFEDFGALHILRESSDTAVGAVERGKVAAYVQALDGHHKARAWTVGDTVKGVFLTSGTDGQRVRVASPGSTMPVANGLLPAESVLPGDRLAVLGTGEFGPADPVNDLPEAATAEAPADEFSDSIQAILDANMTTGAGMSTVTQFANGDLNGGVLGSTEGVIWSDYVANKELTRLAAPEALFVRSLVAGDTSRLTQIRLVRGSAATIPYEEVHVAVSTDATDATTLVDISTGTITFGSATALTGADGPLDINAFSIQHNLSSAGKFEIVTTAAASILWEIPIRDAGAGLGVVTRSASQVAALTIPGGWRGLGISQVAAGSFKTSNISFHVTPPGAFRTDSVVFHLTDLHNVPFIPFVPPGSATSGTANYPAGTRIEGRGKTQGAGGDEDASLVFGVVMERVPA